MSDGPDGSDHGFGDDFGHDFGHGHHCGFDSDFDHGFDFGHMVGFEHGFQSGVIAAMTGGIASGFGDHHADHEGGVSGELHCERLVYLPGIASTPRVVQLLVWPHGHIKPDEPHLRLNHRGVVRRLLETAGFVDVSTKLRDVAPADDVKMELGDIAPFGSPQGGDLRSSAWYENATGHTRSWQDYFMLGHPWLWFGPNVVSPADLELGVYLMVIGRTWYYDQTDDWETRVALIVKARKSWNRRSRQWTQARSAITRSREQAMAVAIHCQKLLAEYPVSGYSTQQRQRLLSAPRPACRLIPPPSTVPRSAFLTTNKSGASGDGIDSFSFPT